MSITIIGPDSPRRKSLADMLEIANGELSDQDSILMTASPTPELKRNFPRWLADFIGVDAKEATHRLQLRWTGLQSPLLKKLIGLMLPVEEFFLCIEDAADDTRSSKSQLSYSIIWYTALGTSIDPKTHQPGNQDFMLAAPPEFSVTDALAKFVTPTPLMAEFFTHFHALRESPPGCAGSFLPPNTWDRVAEDRHLASYRQSKEWQTAVSIYHALNGDYVLLSKTGKTAWAQMETQRIVPLKDDFEAFIQHYVAYRRFSWPFDSWGAKGVLKLES